MPERKPGHGSRLTDAQMAAWHPSRRRGPEMIAADRPCPECGTELHWFVRAGKRIQLYCPGAWDRSGCEFWDTRADPQSP